MKEFQQTKQIAPRMGENLSQLVLQTGVNIQNLHKIAKIKHSGRELPVNKKRTDSSQKKKRRQSITTVKSGQCPCQGGNAS